MMTQMNRRTLLAAVAGATATALAGCTGILDGSDSHDTVALDEPDDFDELQDLGVDYPIYGEKVPEVTVPDIITGDEISSHDYIGERHTMSTFIFTRCPGACPALTSNLVQAQAEAAENDDSDEIAMLEYTFDVEHDTESVFEEYAANMGIDLETGNWHFLRPESTGRAEEVVTEKFGVWFGELDDEEREEMGMHENMAFQHENLILLVNKDGYVERAYEGEPPTPRDVLDDLNTLIERW